jgi:hypothetical protein
MKSVNVAVVIENMTGRETGDSFSVLELVAMGSHAAITGMEAIVIWSLEFKIKTDPLGGLEGFTDRAQCVEPVQADAPKISFSTLELDGSEFWTVFTESREISYAGMRIEMISSLSLYSV